MFEMDERLEADTVFITDWPMCRVLLMNDSNYPWLVLVPRRRGVSEVHELDSSDRARMIDEVAEASRRMQNLHRGDKMNVAALGNLVPQLHVHVVVRYKADPAWPKPIWGVQPAKPYDQDKLAATLAELKAAFATLPS